MKWGREKSVKSGKSAPARKSRRDRRMKKALAGPAKRTAKKKPERRAMIAAARSRMRVVRVQLETFTVAADKRLGVLLVAAPPRVRALIAPRLRWVGRRLGPAGVFVLRRPDRKRVA